MITVGAVRVTALVICVAGIVGMIVTSILNHNGAAVTFGLITAVAIVCSMVAKAVAMTTEKQVLARAAGARPGGAVSAGGADPAGGIAAASHGPSAAAPAAAGERLAEEVERQVQALLAAGANEAEVRRLVGDSVALGRDLAGRSRDKRAGR